MLENLTKTLDTCIDYHDRIGNITKVKQLQAKKELAEAKSLFGDKDDNFYLYQEDEKFKS